MIEDRGDRIEGGSWLELDGAGDSRKKETTNQPKGASIRYDWMGVVGWRSKGSNIMSSKQGIGVGTKKKIYI